MLLKNHLSDHFALISLKFLSKILKESAVTRSQIYVYAVERGCSVKKVLKIFFPKLAEKHLCQSFFFNKVTRELNLLRKYPAQVFS